jgi:hypothetical protein
MALANGQTIRERAKDPRESRAGNPPPAKPASCIQQKIVVTSMRSFPPPAKAVERVYRAKIVIPTVIK